jgi:hypothetical protein
MGHRSIRGALIPSSYIIGSLKIDVKDSIAPQNLTDRAVFGLSKSFAENFHPNLTDHVTFGITKLNTDDLKSNLTESVVITNT